MAKPPPPRPAGLPKAAVAAAVLLILMSVFDLGSLRWEHYRRVFPTWSEGLVRLRYLVSVSQRALGVAAGLGVLARLEWARRLALGVCAFMTLTLPWKHPYEAVHSSFELDQDNKLELLKALMDIGVADPIGAYPSVIRLFIALTSLTNLAIVGWTAYALTRPHVRALFGPKDRPRAS